MTAELGYVLPKYCAYLDVERFPDIENLLWKMELEYLQDYRKQQKM